MVMGNYYIGSHMIVIGDLYFWQIW